MTPVAAWPVALRGIVAAGLWLLYLPAAAALAPHELAVGGEGVPFRGELQYLPDETGSLGYDDVRRTPWTSRFRTAAAGDVNFGFTPTPYWYRLQLANAPQATNRHWVLEIPWPPLNTIDLFVDPADGAAPVVRTGDQRPPGATGLPHRNYAIPLEIDPDERLTLHLRVQVEGSHQLPLRLWSAAGFARKTAQENLYYGMFYGVILVMILYNLLIFLSIRDRSYLYFILYIAALGSLTLSLDGFAFPFLWRISPAFVDVSLSLLIATSGLTIALFVGRALRTSAQAPRLHRALAVMVIAGAIGLLLPALLSQFHATLANIVIAVCAALVVATVIAVQAIRGDRMARVLALVWGAMLAGIVTRALEATGFLPVSPLTTYSLHIGLGLLVTLVSLSLAEQINDARRAKDRQAREHALAESAAKSAFLAKMSHELRTPMNAIAGFTALALDSQSEAQRLEHLGHIDSAARSMLRTLNDVLDLTRLEAGRLELLDRPFELDTVLDQSTSIARAQAAEKGLELTVERSAAVANVRSGDAGRLQQVLMILLDNAVKFTERGGVTLRVTAAAGESDAGELRFEIEDSGIGISDVQMTALFQPFVQGDQSLSRRFGGSGLGLVIARELVELMGGRLEAESEPGHGSRFRFALGLPPAALPAPVAAEHEAASELGGRHVLLVDDNALNRRLAGEILGGAGVTYDTAENGEQAVAAVRERAYDLVLMDLQMPVMDGLAATRAIRDLPTHSQVPIVAMTANAMAQDREAARAHGMNDFLAKPIDAGEMLACIQRQIPTMAGGNQMTSPQDVPAHGNRAADQSGFDLESTLARLSIPRALLIELLKEFAAEQADAPDRLAALMAAGADEEATRAAHSLKGMAANLGCQALAARAEALESMLKSAAGRSGIETGLAGLRAELEAVTQAVAALAAPAPAATAPAPETVAAGDLCGRVDKLIELIEHRDFGSGAQFDALKSSLGEAIGGDEIQDIADALRGFDFSTAGELLRPLAGRLRAVDGGQA